MDSKLPAETRSLLDGLFTAPDDQNRYRLTLLKKLSQSISPSRIKEAVADLEVLSDLYGQLDDIVTKLELGAAGIRYFAGSVLKSRMFQLQQRSRPDCHLHATAFVAHQFYRCQDNMIDLWLSVMSAANLSDAEKVTATQALLEQGQTEDFVRLKDDLAATASDVGWHDILEARSLKLQNRLSPLLRALNFIPNKRAAALLDAIDQFKADGDLAASHASIDFLDAAQKAALVRTDGTFRVSLYKVFLFQAVTTRSSPAI